MVSYGEGMAQRAVAVHFPNEEVRDDYTVCIFDFHSVSDNCAHPFLARLGAPTQLVDRWRGQVGGVRGQYIVGKYQSGLGGDYAFANAGRTDPKSSEEGFRPADMATVRVPSLSEINGVYLWHCGSPPAVSWLYESCIINLKKIWDDTDPVAKPTVNFQTGSLAQSDGNGILAYRRRYFGSPDEEPSFSIAENGEVSCSLPLLGTAEGTYAAQIVYGLNLYI
jgi:hypothetical protein